MCRDVICESSKEECLSSLGQGRRPLRIVCLHLNLKMHRRGRQPSHLDARQDGHVVRRPLAQKLDEATDDLLVQGRRVQAKLEHLVPALAAGVPQVQFDVAEDVLKLLLDIFRHLSRFGVPSTWIVSEQAASKGVGFGLVVTYIGLSIRYGRRLVLLGCNGGVRASGGRARGRRNI